MVFCVEPTRSARAQVCGRRDLAGSVAGAAAGAHAKQLPQDGVAASAKRSGERATRTRSFGMGWLGF